MNADNQQERLQITENFKWFLAGLIEGEGSLCISLKQHPTARFGYYVDPEFFLYQHKSARELLGRAKEFFGTGAIIPKPGNEDVLVYRITSRRSIVEKVIPFFEKYMRYGSDTKRRNFQFFKEATLALENKAHKTLEGTLRLVDLAYSINHAGKQRKRSKEEVIGRILRDYTPDSKKMEKI
jgi:hypothetical protein